MSYENHKREIAGITDMKQLAELIGDLHYETLSHLLSHLYRKIDNDAHKDHEAGRENIAAALQYLGYGLYESALRADKVWLIAKPYMEEPILCPSCGKEWYTTVNKSCACGATVV